MRRRVPGQIRVFLAMDVLAGVIAGCDAPSSLTSSELAVATSMHSASFHLDGHPPFWTRWTTDGATAIELGERFLARGLRCSGRYCDDLGLLGVESAYAQTNSWWTDSFSEEDTNYRICDGNGFVTGLRCTGRYCDNVSLRCSQLNNGGVRTNCYWTASISEESGGYFVGAVPTYVAGASCNGRYCDSLNLYVCEADERPPAHDLAALAVQFAPRLRFDQETTTGSGQQSKCFPGDAGTYYAERAWGVNPVSLCNKDYSTIQKNQIPVYYIANEIGSDAVIIRYWFFYAWQSTCFANLGDHAADWESMAVLIVGGQLRRVSYWQHGGWYSREPGGFELVSGTHPVGYVGKNAHGTYHDDGGSGGCLYFEDYRNPGGNDYHMDTWRNLVALRRSGDAPEWMNCSGPDCFDGIWHPIDQTGDVRSTGGCGKDGCDRSSVGANIPMIDDPTGAEYMTVSAQHSGRAIDVPGASTANGVNLTQYSNWHVDNQRWMLESTGDDYFTVRARHSGKCMDVPGATQSAGANVTQYDCNGGANQQFRLLSYGDGHYALQTKHSSQCLDIAGGALGDGGLLIQWPCAWTLNERFSFAP